MEENVNKTYSEEELRKIAVKRIRKKRDLISDIGAYVIINAFLIAIYYLSGSHDDGMPWFVWILAGWGIFLVMHIFNTVQELSFKLNVNAVDKEVEKLKKRL